MSELQLLVTKRVVEWSFPLAKGRRVILQFIIPTGERVTESDVAALERYLDVARAAVAVESHVPTPSAASREETDG